MYKKEGYLAELALIWLQEAAVLVAVQNADTHAPERWHVRWRAAAATAVHAAATKLLLLQRFLRSRLPHSC